MAPHLSAVELDHVQQLLQKGKSPVEIHNSLRRLRGRRKVEPPHITNLRRVLKGFTYKRSAVDRMAFWPQPAGSAGGWIFDFGPASLGCAFPHKNIL